MASGIIRLPYIISYGRVVVKRTRSTNSFPGGFRSSINASALSDIARAPKSRENDSNFNLRARAYANHIAIKFKNDVTNAWITNNKTISLFAIDQSGALMVSI